MSKKFFRKFSWFLVGYNVLVILWGAVVRSTGSGAGCGNHWPLCNGEVIPTAPHITTVIEFSHRMSSMLDGFLVIFLVFLAYRLYGKGSSIFRWAAAALVVIVIEGMLGRLLVVQDWVADNVSIIRAVVVAIHLVNTYILLFTLTVTAWKANLPHEVRPRNDKRANTLIGIGLISAILFSAMGAVTALGDTLFPAEALFSGVPHGLEGAGRFLVQLRVIHPIMAILTSSYLFLVVRHLLNREMGSRTDKRGKWLLTVIGVQVMAGGFTVLTLAPIFMQILHLLLADVFWIFLVVYALEIYYTPRRIS